MVHQNGVPVRGRLGNLTCRDRAAGAGHVLDNLRRAEVLSHRLGDKARYRVGGTACCERHNERDLSCRVVSSAARTATGTRAAARSRSRLTLTGDDYQCDARQHGRERGDSRGTRGANRKP